MPFRPLLPAFLLLSAVLPPLARSQDTPPSAAPAELPAPSRPEVLRGRLALIQDIDTKIQKAQLDLTAKPPPSAGTIGSLQQELTELRDRRRALQNDLTRDISGVPDLNTGPPPDADIKKQLEEAVRPVLDFATELMKQPREIEQLRRNITQHETEIGQLTRALEGTEKTLAELGPPAASPAPEDGELRALLQAHSEDFRSRRNILASELTSLKTQLESILSGRKSVGHYAGQLMSDYVIQRVWNLLLALLTFGGILTILRWIHQWMRRRNFLRRLGLSPFLSRVGDVLYYTLTLLIATGAAFIVLYASSDWLLLSLAMLLVAGLILLSRQTLPRFYDQAKLMLNLGSVREGERVIWQGLPYLVRRLHLFSELTNPSLTGATIRLPLRSLGDLASRPFAPKERWFPTEEGQWVTLDDGSFGKVIQQTPEFVQLVLIGGSYKTYPTPLYLAQNPCNLSQQFRINTVFSLDYRHLPDITTVIPETLVRTLREHLLHTMEPEDIRSIKVELSAAGASSLDLTILADFAGKAASQYNSLPRLIQTCCVRTALAEGWTIPFPQLVLHRGENG